MNNLTSFLHTKGIGIIWIGAVFGPVLVVIGVVEEKVTHLMLGIGLLLLVLWSIIEGFKALRNHSKSKFIASAFVPIVSIAVGTIFALIQLTKLN
ncbi:MAG: hypothetical protein KZQ82_17805 [Candidatus Thiodiazotropha sp. (ex Lucinoma annulata)]|nr:hypothetical protein [Candidatus Thiodiazotropha sp. (ex Lucinoma borealis)]MCU7886048.1 hypothetical protein [Candidatus Thiodiazotropha sp. (ex Lucinoma annulata)]MCU7947130.1 hypothetical protein [Candidatus Thiodiazotropha sp. (ex Cardiolucina cf. quadrata)]MCU7856899.1 hypothetical protein [Candidatus Thiodiazotropha sp. (ex Lucinoma borealis)]MCU7863826.1 hypothetical protein [Candidatus Thiodiazotropha sp. (ex Lucinoma borealis)]